MEHTELIPEEGQPAVFIFKEENVDGVLNRGVGTYRTIQYLRTQYKQIPKSCLVSDLHHLVESVDTEGDFIEATFINFFLDCKTNFDNEFLQELDEDSFPLDSKFIEDRLSDLQNIGDQFTFTAFLVRNASIGDITAISSYPALTTVSLQGNLITDVTQFTKLPNLRSLNLDENRLKSLDSVHFPLLESFSAASNQISLVHSISAPLMRSINLNTNRIFYASFKGCPLLNEIDLSSNSLGDFKDYAFEGLSRLSVLKANGNMLTYFKIRKGMENLVDLDISDNPIKILRGFEKLNALEVLDIHKTEILNADQLRGIPNLKYLYVYDSVLGNRDEHRLEILHYLEHIEEIDEVQITSVDIEESKELFRRREMEEEEEHNEEEEQ